MGCIWLYLGQNSPCKIDLGISYLDENGEVVVGGDGNAIEDCTPSWKFKAGFEDKSYHT
jgi:hypothetical protein